MRLLRPLLATLAFAPLVAAADPIKLVLDAQSAIDLPSPQLSGIERSLADTILAALNSDRLFPQELPLVNPPSWGKTISEATHGRVEYLETFQGAFLCRLTLSGLEPEHDYRLALNGKPGLAGNELLPTPVPGLPEERFFDFLDIRTDAKGAYAATLAIKLRAGQYDIRIYVKDPSDWKIILYRDYFEFTVEES